MGCFYAIFLLIAAVICALGFFNKPWNHSKTIYIILICLFTGWVILSTIEIIIIYDMAFNGLKYGSEELKRAHAENYKIMQELNDPEFYKRMAYFSFLAGFLGLFNLVGVIFAFRLNKKISFIIGGILFFCEIGIIMFGLAMVGILRGFG
jgi:hypothetical protein